MNRRTSLLSLLASGVGIATIATVNAADEPQADKQLIEIAKNPHVYMFADQATDRVDGKGFIKIHSIATGNKRARHIELRPGTIRYFRADGAVASDGKRAEITWTLGDKTYSTQVGTPGSVIMVVRSLDGLVSWYSMQLDTRC